MSFKSNVPATAKAHLEAASSKYSFSRKRWSAFDAWQEHVRKSAASVGSAFLVTRDRDLRRDTVPG